MSFPADLFTDHTLRTVALGAGLAGAGAGALGTFAVLRRQSLVGDAISHAALPGVALAFLAGALTGGGWGKHPLALLAGAFVAGWLGMLCVALVTRTTRIKSDTALGIVLSVFFGLGLMLLTIIQNMPTASKAGLDKFLFGNAATILTQDVVVIAVVTLAALAALALCWKEFKLLSFDPEFMAVQGGRMAFFDILLTTLIVVAIVTGLQTVGVVLMSALLVAPAAAARQWSDRLGVVTALAALFGALSGVTGAALSSSVPRLSTGPTIVLVVSAIVLVSLFLAPARGLLWAHLRHLRLHREVRTSTVLVALYNLAGHHSSPHHPHSAEALDAVGVHAAANTLGQLEQRGLVERSGDDWRLTTAGVTAAEEQLAAGGAQ